MPKRIITDLHISTHGMKGTRVYASWHSMKDRCLNANGVDFHRYGGRGINICQEWLAFEAFYADMGDRPENTSIDRIDNDGDYCPDNCRWATPKEQMRNRTCNRLLTFNGETKCMSEWAEIIGVSKHVIYGRIGRGHSAERALTQPLRKLKPYSEWNIK